MGGERVFEAIFKPVLGRFDHRYDCKDFESHHSTIPRMINRAPNPRVDRFFSVDRLFQDYRPAISSIFHLQSFFHRMAFFHRFRTKKWPVVTVFYQSQGDLGIAEDLWSRPLGCRWMFPGAMYPVLRVGFDNRILIVGYCNI